MARRSVGVSKNVAMKAQKNKAQKAKEGSRASSASGKKAPMRGTKPISHMSGSGSSLGNRGSLPKKGTGGQPPTRQPARVSPEPRGKATPRSGGVKSIGRARPSRARTSRRGPGSIVA